MRIIEDRHDFAASIIRGDIPNMPDMLLAVTTRDTPMKREEIFSALRMRYGISHELANDLAKDELGILVEDGKLIRPKRGYYVRA